METDLSKIYNILAEHPFCLHIKNEGRDIYLGGSDFNLFSTTTHNKGTILLCDRLITPYDGHTSFIDHKYFDWNIYDRSINTPDCYNINRYIDDDNLITFDYGYSIVHSSDRYNWLRYRRIRNILTISE